VTFGAIARLKFFAACFAASRHYKFNGCEDGSFALKENSRSPINPFSECANASHGADVKYPRPSSWLVVLAQIAVRDAVSLAQLKYFYEQWFGASNRQHWMPGVFGDVNTTVAIKNTSHKMICETARDYGARTHQCESLSQLCRAYGDRYFMRAFTDRVLGTKRFTKGVDMRSIDCGQPKRDRSFRRMPVCVKKAEPVRFAFRIYGVEKCLVN